MGQSTPPLSDGVQGTVQSSSSSSTNNKYNNSSSSTDDLQSRSLLLRIILSKHEEDDNNDNSGNNNNIRNLSLTTALQSLTTYDVLREVQVLDEFRRTRRSSSSSSSEEEEEESSTNNLYERVRALFFLYAVHRFHLPERRKIIVNKLKLKKRTDNGSTSNSNYDDGSVGTDTDNNHLRQHQKILNEENDDTTATNLKDEEMVFCPRGYAALLDRRFDESIDHFLASVSTSSSTIPISPNDDDYESNNNNNSDIKDKEEGREYRHATPRRTSLLSNLTFSRMGSSATTSSSIDSELFEYSTCNDGSRDGGSANHMMSSTRSSLEGERLLSSATIRSSASTRQTTSVDDDGNDNNEKQPTMLLLPSDATSSALAKSYRELAFQTLANQVKTSVRLHPENEWMFTLKNVNEQPLRWSKELFLAPNKYKEEEGEEGNNKNKGCYQQPILLEKTPVRMDLSHSCWSDIFFLGMDYPEAARVINCSVDLSVQRSPTTAAATHDDDSNNNNNALPKPPIECKLQLTTSNPGTIRLTSVHLQTSVLLTHVSQVFNYGADYLGLLKAGIVACGIVPLGLEKQCCGSVDGKKDDMLIKDLLMTMMPSTATTDNDGGECLYGLELTTNVHNIPKGSRLAVSTNLLGSIIAVGMRATQQTKCLTGPLVESERRLVAARAILGEWLGGSGGGWQDSGGVWPGLKLIHGVKSREGDPEYGISRGCLLPQHRLLNKEEAPESLLYALEQSLVLVHGGMAQNVG